MTPRLNTKGSRIRVRHGFAITLLEGLLRPWMATLTYGSGVSVPSDISSGMSTSLLVHCSRNQGVAWN